MDKPASHNALNADGKPMMTTDAIKNNPALQKVNDLLIEGGRTQAVIGKIAGVAQSTVSKVGSNPDVRAIMDKINLESLEVMAPTIFNNRKQRIEIASDLIIKKRAGELAKDEAENYYKDQELSQRDERIVGQNTGMDASHSLPVSIQQLNIYNKTQTIISDTFMKILATQAQETNELPPGITIDPDNNPASVK
jgi:hypothetical protein